jgi:hypothetical protein
MSYLVKIGLISHMDKYSSPLLKASLLFFKFGSKSGGMSVLLRGTPKKEVSNQGVDTTKGKELSVEWQIGVHDGDGPQVPSISSIVMAKKLAAHAQTSQFGSEPLYPPGARPCLGFFTLDELKEEMKRLHAFFYVERRLGGDYLKKENLYEMAIGDSYFKKLLPSLQNFHSVPQGGKGKGKEMIGKRG